MSTTAVAWTEADTERANRIGCDYQRSHDLTAQRGQAVGLDPASGQVWFGNSAKDIGLRLEVHFPNRVVALERLV
ncbi:MAG: hypothetical protein KIS67_13065 [Verrucomicrobiae bacterium]|nr:hypothetical protein [Verrucomicrobiae bacterium]